MTGQDHSHHSTAADVAPDLGRRGFRFENLDRRRFLVGLLIALTALTYVFAAGHQFVNWDDPIVLLDRARIRSLALPNLIAIWTQPHHADFFPVTETLYAIQYQIDGYNPAVFHVVSILLHLACTGLVFKLAEELGLHVAGAFAAALLFGLHPIHVESVAWVADQKDLLACLFSLLSVMAFIVHHRDPSVHRHFVAFNLGLLAILSKPSAVSLGVCLFVVQLVTLKAGARKAFIRSLPLLVAGVLFSVIVIRMHQTAGNMPSESFTSISHSLVAIVYGFAFPLWKFFWPYPLLPDYQVGALSWDRPEVWGAFLTVFAIAGVMGLFRRQTWTLLAFGWYAAAILPVLRFVQVGGMTVADRYMYFPSVGLCLLVGFVVQFFLERSDRRKSPLIRRTTIAVSCVTAIILIVLTIPQVMIWKNSRSLWTHTLKHQPDSSEALLNFGLVLDAEGRYADAVRYFDSVLELDPDSVNARYNKGISLTRQEKLDDAMAIYTELFALDDHHASAHYNMANILAHLDRTDEAIHHFYRAIEIAPDHLDARRELGSLLAKTGRCAEARGFLESVIQARPADAAAYIPLAACQVAAGQYADAARTLQQGFKFDNTHVRLATELVWLWATCPDETVRNPQGALRIAAQIEKAMQGSDRRVLDALAAAQAANSRYKRAVKTAQRALDAPVGRGGDVKAEDIRLRIQLYQQQTPYREHPQ